MALSEIALGSSIDSPTSSQKEPKETCRRKALQNKESLISFLFLRGFRVEGLRSVEERKWRKESTGNFFVVFLFSLLSCREERNKPTQETPRKREDEAQNVALPLHLFCGDSAGPGCQDRASS
jgi:hypothetical protein